MKEFGGAAQGWHVVEGGGTDLVGSQSPPSCCGRHKTEAATAPEVVGDSMQQDFTTQLGEAAQDEAPQAVVFQLAVDGLGETAASIDELACGVCRPSITRRTIAARPAGVRGAFL